MRKPIISNRDPLRYLQQRGKTWHYVRRVPSRFAHIDDRGTIRTALHTSSLDVAQLRRDALERADDLLWQGLAVTEDSKASHARYQAARARAVALGFEYKAAADLAESSPIEELVARIAAAASAPRDEPAVLGGLDVPSVSVREAMKIYQKDIAADELKGMSEAQIESWRKVKDMSVDMFCEVIGDKPLLDITRQDAHKFHKHFLERMRSEGISGNTANRRFGNMRKLFREYVKYMQLDRPNPFDDLNFKDKKTLRKVIPPFEASWIRDRMLHGDVMRRLNKEARCVMLAMVETGARPSEICNLRPENIHLDAPVPYITVKFVEDRALKTENSIRDLPLVGVSLEAMKLFPKGFPRYRDKETNLSGACMKFMKVNGLLPTKNHRVYSIRHAYEKRMLEANFDDEFRRRTLGHDTDRPEYGDGGSLAWRAEKMRGIALTWDPAVLE